MPAEPNWDAARAVANCPQLAWHGSAWRAHRRKYAAVDPGGSLRVSGRYNRGLDWFPSDHVWPALYLALAPDVCLGEILRHITPELLPQLNDYRISELSLELAAVLDCREIARLGLTPDEFWSDTDYRLTQGLAAAAIARGSEGLLVPSATRLGDNLVLFPRQLDSDSRIVVVSSRDPRLYVAR